MHHLGHLGTWRWGGGPCCQQHPSAVEHLTEERELALCHPVCQVRPTEQQALGQ